VHCQGTAKLQNPVREWTPTHNGGEKGKMIRWGEDKAKGPPPDHGENTTATRKRDAQRVLPIRKQYTIIRLSDSYPRINNTKGKVE